MIDHQDAFINQKVDAYLKNCLHNAGWTHFSKNKCTQKHRNEIFKRVCQMLTLMGIEFETESIYRNSYKIQVTKKKKREDATYRKIPGRQNGRVSAKVSAESWNVDPFRQG